MNEPQFQKLCSEILDRSEDIMFAKAQEYAPVDRLENFKRRLPVLREQKASQVILSDMSKHIDALARAVDTGNYRWCWADDDGEGAKQRIADAINYLLLLAAAMEEENV